MTRKRAFKNDKKRFHSEREQNIRVGKRINVDVNGDMKLSNLQDKLGNQAVRRMLAQQGINRISNELVQRELEDIETLGSNHQPNDGQVTIEDVTTDYYNVTGNTLAEVAGQLDPNEWGRCTYQYEFNYETTNGRTNKVNITLRLTIRLPRWQGRGFDQASPAAKREWQRMLEALQDHEDKHADIARKWAPIFKERLLNIRSGRVQARYQQTLQRVNRETRQFDQQTQHGRTEGVTLDTSIQ